MGHAFAMLTLRNPRYSELPGVEVEALADTGATFLCVPAEIAEVLRLENIDGRKEAVLTDGRRQFVPYVGPLEVRFKGRVASAARWSWASAFCSEPSRWRTWTSSSCRAAGGWT